MDDGKDNVIKPRQLGSCNSTQWFDAEWNMILFHWLHRSAVLEYAEMINEWNIK